MGRDPPPRLLGSPLLSPQANLVSLERSLRRRPLVALTLGLVVILLTALILHPTWPSVRELPRVIISSYDITVSHHETPFAGPKPNTENDEASIHPDELGVLLSSQRPSLTSPNGAYVLSLKTNGDLVLAHQTTNGVRQPVWWTGTGHNHHQGRRNRVTLSSREDGTPVLGVDAYLDNEWRTVWHSGLEPACMSRAPGPNTTDDAGIDNADALCLHLSNDGRLRLPGVCDLYSPPTHHETNRSLAIIVSGLYRTHNTTCQTHRANLIHSRSAFSQIDVFVYLLYEDTDIEAGLTPAGIEAGVRACYGPHLRSVTVAAASAVEEPYPGSRVDIERTCGRKLKRLNNQLKTIHTAATHWWSWSVGQGVTHDTVLRIRPDTNLGSEPAFWTLEELGSNTVVLVQPRDEHYFYCPGMTGRVGVGPSDQIAYGSPAAMAHWLHMYADFPQTVDLASGPDRPALRDFSGCEELPSGPAPGDCARPAPCSIECMVAWYLEAKGVRFAVEWGWDQGILRPWDVR